MLIRSPSIDEIRILPLRDWVYVRRCLSAPGTEVEFDGNRPLYSQGGIAIPDMQGDSTTWAEIIAVGSLCTGLNSGHGRLYNEEGEVTKFGHRAMCAEDGIGHSDNIRRIQGEEFFVREEEIFMIAPPYEEK
jgi:co-chaperonin GroES (HSP10)